MNRFWLVMLVGIAAAAMASLAYASDADNVLGRGSTIEVPAGPAEPFYVYA